MAQVVLAMGPFNIWQTEEPFQYEALDEEGADEAVTSTGPKRKARQLERNDLLEHYFPTYGTRVEDHTYRRYLQLGGTSDEWSSIKQKFPSNTLLHWLAALWKREESVEAMNNTWKATLVEGQVRQRFADISKSTKGDDICLTILGDIPQEPGYEGDDGFWDMAVKPVRARFYINCDTSSHTSRSASRVFCCFVTILQRTTQSL